MIIRKSILMCILLGVTTPWTQKAQGQKFNDAIKRSKEGAELISDVAKLPDKAIPKELITRAEAIGVFPCKKTDLLIESAVICPGVISSYITDSWSLPAYYRFGAGGLGRPDPVVRDATVVILLFMDKEAVDWLSKGFSLSKDRIAVAGPLDRMSEDERVNLAKAHLIGYVYKKNVLIGRTLELTSFGQGMAVGSDRNINENLYGLKAWEILAGKSIPTSRTIPAEIPAYQQALKEHYGTRSP